MANKQKNKLSQLYKGDKVKVISKHRVRYGEIGAVQSTNSKIWDILNIRVSFKDRGHHGRNYQRKELELIKRKNKKTLTTMANKQKKLWWLLESNADLSVTTTLKNCQTIINSDFSNCTKKEQKETQYTLTPVWLTDEEYSKLPEE